MGNSSEFKNNVLALANIAIEAGFDVFVVTDASGTFDAIVRAAAWERMSAGGVQLLNWFAVACDLHRDWRNDIEGLGNLLSNHIPLYRGLITSYFEHYLILVERYESFIQDDTDTILYKLHCIE